MISFLLVMHHLPHSSPSFNASFMKLVPFLGKPIPEKIVIQFNIEHISERRSTCFQHWSIDSSHICGMGCTFGDIGRLQCYPLVRFLVSMQLYQTVDNIHQICATGWLETSPETIFYFNFHSNPCQAIFNYKRKSTAGWSIGTILLDVTGGILSMLQMVVNAYNYGKWLSITSLYANLLNIFFFVQF